LKEGKPVSVAPGVEAAANRDKTIGKVGGKTA
jgi:hypothetical protein